MATWGAGVFENDDALDFVADNMDELYKAIEEFFNLSEPNYIEDGEGQIIPRIALMTMMAKLGRLANDPIVRCAPPEQETIDSWRKQYLSGYDSQIDDYEPEEEYSAMRRDELVKVFDELEEESKLLEEAIEESREKEKQEEDQFLQLAVLIDDDSEVMIRCAEIFVSRQMWEEAIEKYEEALEIGVEEFSEGFALNSLAWCYAQIEEYDKAMECAKESVDVEAPFSQFFGTVGYVYLCQNKFEEALEQYNKALEMHDNTDKEELYDPTLAETHYWRSKVHEKLGNKKARDKDIQMIKTLGCKPPEED